MPKQKSTPGQFYSVSDCAAILGVSTKTIYRAIESGELIAAKGKRLIRISRPDWQRFLRRHYPLNAPRAGVSARLNVAETTRFEEE